MKTTKTTDDQLAALRRAGYKPHARMSIMGRDLELIFSSSALRREVRNGYGALAGRDILRARPDQAFRTVAVGVSFARTGLGCFLNFQFSYLRENDRFYILCYLFKNGIIVASIGNMVLHRFEIAW